jgi:hypothetical protein
MFVNLGIGANPVTGQQYGNGGKNSRGDNRVTYFSDIIFTGWEFLLNPAQQKLVFIPDIKNQKGNASNN